MYRWAYEKEGAVESGEPSMPHLLIWSCTWLTPAFAMNVMTIVETLELLSFYLVPLHGFHSNIYIYIESSGQKQAFFDTHPMAPSHVEFSNIPSRKWSPWSAFWWVLRVSLGLECRKYQSTAAFLFSFLLACPIKLIVSGEVPNTFGPMNYAHFGLSV